MVAVCIIHPRRRAHGRQSRPQRHFGAGGGAEPARWGDGQRRRTAARATPDRIAVQQRNHVLELAWSDTEERLQGAIQPDQPVEGQPFKVLLNVGSFQGAAFEGPLTITLREAGTRRDRCRR